MGTRVDLGLGRGLKIEKRITMAVRSFPSTFSSLNDRLCPNFYSFRNHSSLPIARRSGRRGLWLVTASLLCSQKSTTLDKSTLKVAETIAEDELWAAACLRVRSFYEFQSSFGIEDHKRYLVDHEFEALKERVAGKRKGFRRVSCINASLPFSEISKISNDLSAACKFVDNGQDRVVVGTLDLNQCLRLPDEITGRKPEGIGADFARAYLSNVCVAKELHQNGLGYALVAESKMIAQKWGITDLYVHVAVDNEPAKKLYKKSGFVYESDEPAWHARFLDRPRRFLLWNALPAAYDL
ncbi:GCN5-related N-acetyltransferase 7, chloroplastic isoform X1 [Malania oleifera]|uniref:GCN5-related N-acetyltransferase 7, chloroplastic isoform X1 n=1 Tax=Malania oleifera TaxID=397392 RepID=UPI0025AE2186|nr:GCN5-related N-acetyltransferase 7, chloroplastic isoform X1 [Malania oleifera]